MKPTSPKIKLKRSGLGSKKHPQHSLTKNNNDSTDLIYANLLPLDTENNNVQSPKLKIISNHRIRNNVKKSVNKRIFSPNERYPENAIKIEITEHDLELDNIQALEDIHKVYDDIIACERPLGEGNRNNIENEGHSIEEMELENIVPVESNRENKSFDSQKHKYKGVDQKPAEGIEKNEKLFIRLVKLDITSKLIDSRNSGDDPLVSNENGVQEECHKDPIPMIKLEFLPKLEKPTKKVSKTEVHRQNLLNINKTESLKMEQLLLEKFKKAQEKLGSEGSSKEASENSADEIEQYVYEKTSKSVHETYNWTDDGTGRIILKCLLCPFTCERFKQMSLHYKFKHRETPIEEMHFCNVKDCNFKTVHKGMLKWHMRRHMLATDKIESNSYPCDKCQKVFDQRKGFLIHLKHKHKDPIPAPRQTDFPCATCNFRTTTKQNLQAHIYRVHMPDDIKPFFNCNICGYKTHYKDCLKKHLTRIHLQK